MGTRQDKWTASLDAVNAFINANARYPSTTSQNPSEKTLAQWWSRQRYLLAKHKNSEKTSLTPQQIESLEQSLTKNESLERDGVWNKRYEIIVNQYKMHGKLFSYKSDNADEQKAMRWWNQQKTFARKFLTNPESPVGGMTKDRFDKIIALLRLTGHEINNSLETQSSSQNNG
jgi:hypothetical protein